VDLANVTSISLKRLLAFSTPTLETHNRLREEATKLFAHSAKCQSIALTMHATSPILPFSTIPITFE
jgi:hypothetical protein